MSKPKVVRVEEGWAVRLRSSRGERPWLNETGGYTPERRARAVWWLKSEARDAAAMWPCWHPVLVRVVFWAREEVRGG